MPSPFPLSRQLLDGQMRLCASLGVFSQPPSSLRWADITHSVLWLGWVGRWPSGSFGAPLFPQAGAIGRCFFFFFLSRKADVLHNPSNMTDVLHNPSNRIVLPGKGDSFSFEVWQRFLLYKTDAALALHKSSCLPRSTERKPIRQSLGEKGRRLNSNTEKKKKKVFNTIGTPFLFVKVFL